MKDNNELKTIREYTKEEIRNSAIIMHPNFEGYDITINDICMLFEEWSNFTTLNSPIYDNQWNEFWDSEWYYMAARTKDSEIKKMISFLSIWYGLSRKSRKLFDLDQKFDNRIVYMREAIKKKFDANPHLKEKLLQTWDMQIVEYTYWWDVFFGIDQKTMKWANILWKLLMEYRHSCKK